MGLVFTGVLLLHVSLVLTVQYIRRNSAACAAFWCWCVRRRPPQPPRVLAAGGPVAEALESRASIAAATSPASFRKRKLGIMLPDFLVFPYLEIFIYVFFLVSLANAAGMLVAVGFAASPHRVAPIAVGIGILVLMAALTAAAVVLLTRMYRRAARLGLEYVPKPRPPPQGEREGRVSRWLRLAEVSVVPPGPPGAGSRRACQAGCRPLSVHPLHVECPPFLCLDPPSNSPPSKSPSPPLFPRSVASGSGPREWR